MSHLDLLFERELFKLKEHYFKHEETKNDKVLLLELAAISRNMKDALLKEYLSMCKIVFRIRTIVA